MSGRVRVRARGVVPDVAQPIRHSVRPSGNRCHNARVRCWPIVVASLLVLALAGCGAGQTCGPTCQARRRLGAQCDAGDARACYDLARGLTSGGNRFAEPDAAARHERACELGLVEACGLAGLYYRDGPGFDHPDPARALRSYARGCEGVDAGDCVQSALLRLRGPASLRDDADAARLLARGLSSRTAAAHRELALLYRDGRGVPRDPARAIALLREGCAREDEHACETLGLYVWIGFGAPPDPAAAERALTDACRLGAGSACDLTRLLAAPPLDAGQHAIIGQLAQNPDQGISIFHASGEPPPVGATATLYSAVGGERASAWAAVAAGTITAATPDRIAMTDTSDYRVKVNFRDGATVALTWTEQ